MLHVLFRSESGPGPSAQKKTIVCMRWPARIPQNKLVCPNSALQSVRELGIQSEVVVKIVVEASAATA